VDISLNILSGRPYGGTAILFRKSIANLISVIDSDVSQILGVKMSTTIGPLLLITVYMATDYEHEYSLESYRDCLRKLHALIADPDAVHTIIAGDFNCSSNSRFLESFVILLETINWLYLT